MIDLNDSNFINSDRTDAYARVRQAASVLPFPTGSGPTTWLAGRYADVQAILRMPTGRLYPIGLDAPPWISGGAALKRLRGNLGQTDGQLHSRLRSVVGGFFMPRKIELLRAISSDSVARAMRAIEGQQGEFDMVRNFAAEIPKGVICHLLNIPEEDWPRLIEVQHDYLLLLSLTPLTPDECERVERVVQFYFDYFEAILDTTPPDQRSEFVQLLLDAQERGEIDRTETLCLMHTVLDAGFETTRTSISNAVELLALHPAQFAELRANPALIDNAIEELLRLRTPIHIRQRVLLEPYTTSDGTALPVGDQVLLLMQSANLDESIFPDPGKLDFKRNNAGRHQAFGGGMHHCLGAPLARIQLQETLKALVSSYSGLTLTRGKGPRFPSPVFPGLAELWITMDRH
jgi:cytochrome P450